MTIYASYVTDAIITNCISSNNTANGKYSLHILALYVNIQTPHVLLRQCEQIEIFVKALCCK